MSKKITYEFIKTAFEQEGYILLSLQTEYENRASKLYFVCPNGHEYYTTWNSFRGGHRCRICNTLKQTGENNFSWKGGVFKSNFPLYDTYAEQLITYNNIHVTNHNNLILLGVECTYCKNIFVPTSSEVHRRIRALHGKRPGDANFYCSENCKTSCTTYGQIKYPKGFNQKDNIRSGQTQWSLLVKKRDNYICQKCGLKEDIMYAHHINPVAFEPLESMDIDNGITLCKKCHKMIHQLPGCLINELRC